MSINTINNKRVIGDAELYLGDCLELMLDLPDASVDMILCDLPYGTTACKWDSVIPFEPLWEQYRRIAKRNAAIVLTASQPFTSRLVMSNLGWFRHEWIWKKNCGSNFASLKRNPFKEHESVVVFSDRPLDFYPIRQERSAGGMAMVKSCKYTSKAGGETIGGKMKTDKAKRDPKMRHPSSVQAFNVQRGHHPTQKPVALMEYLIRTYTNEGETVLDNCMGSGTTGIAASMTGRRFIGMEMDVGYFEIAAERIRNIDSVVKGDNRED